MWAVPARAGTTARKNTTKATAEDRSATSTSQEVLGVVEAPATLGQDLSSNRRGQRGADFIADRVADDRWGLAGQYEADKEGVFGEDDGEAHIECPGRSGLSARRPARPSP